MDNRDSINRHCRYQPQGCVEVGAAMLTTLLASAATVCGPSFAYEATTRQDPDLVPKGW